MSVTEYLAMDLDTLRSYVLSHREDIDAFHIYVDRSKAAGRMQSINPSNPDWKQKLDQVPFHHPQEQNYWDEEVEVETAAGEKRLLRTYLLRLYPERYYGYDAYMDIPLSHSPDIKRVCSSRLAKQWDVIAGPEESQINGYFRGDDTKNNPPAWVFGLRVVAG